MLEKGTITTVSTFADASSMLTEFDNSNENACYRGEASLYDATQESLFRLKPDVMMAFFAYLNPNLSNFIFRQKLASYVTNHAGFHLLNDEPFGCPNLTDNSYDCEPRHTMHGIDGLLQHYGFPTQWIDISRDLSVALTFASQHSNSQHCRIFFGNIDDFYGCGDVIDIAKFATQIREIIPIDKSRPELQSGIAVRMSRDSQFRNRLYCLEFPKPEISAPVGELFPLDGLGTWFRGMAVDYRLDLRKRMINAYGEGYVDDVRMEQNIDLALSHLELL